MHGDQDYVTRIRGCLSTIAKFPVHSLNITLKLGGFIAQQGTNVNEVHDTVFDSRVSAASRLHDVLMSDPQPAPQIYSSDFKSDPWHLLTTMTHAPWDSAQLQIHQWQPRHGNETNVDDLIEDAPTVG